MTEIIAFALGAVPFGAAFFFAQHAWQKERARLLDRIMARDWDSYRMSVREPDPEPRVLTEAERKAQAEEERLIESAHGLA